MSVLAKDLKAGMVFRPKRYPQYSLLVTEVVQFKSRRGCIRYRLRWCYGETGVFWDKPQKPVFGFARLDARGQCCTRRPTP